MPYQFTSTSYHLRPWRDDVGWAWWLLCQPSPKVSSATSQLFVDLSRVEKRREPHRWVAELTSQVACKPSTVRTKMPHIKKGSPPVASSTRPSTIIGT